MPKLGVAGFLPGDWGQLDRAWAERVHAAGFSGASVFFQKPLEVALAEVRRMRADFAAAGLAIAQANGWYESLVNSDEALRSEGVRGLQALIHLGRVLDADTVYVRPGSLNPRGHWWPHPDNHSPKTFDRLVQSLSRAACTAGAEGMTLAVEGHVLSPLDTPQRVRDLLDAVASPVLRFNVDPVNFIGTVRDAHDTAHVINELFDLLGPDIVAGHAKDCALEEALVVHIKEVVPGRGTLDYSLFLRRFAACCPHGYLLIEHLPDDQIPTARAAVCAAADQAGLSFDP
jgi:sugar phosphate isomerase/epimerase